MTSKHKQAGLLSIDAAMTLLVLTILISLASVWMIRQMDNQDYRIAADKQRTVAEALGKYLKDNYSTVLASATATAPVQVTVAMLKNTNYLPAGFADTNAFGQAIIGLARKPNPNQLEAIVVTTGGQAIPELGVRTIAENLGGPGGFISSTNPNVIQGVRGGWQVALSNYAISPGAGHTASALFLMDGSLANDYLYRNAVPGHPELNTMNTALNMGGNNINNAGAITASGNVATSRDVTARDVTASGTLNGVIADIKGETYTGGWFRTRGDTGWYSEKWGGGIYQADPDWVRIYNDKGLATGGTLVGGQVVAFGNMTATGRISTNEFISIGGVATKDTPCSDNRLIAKDPSGLQLSCQDGFWKSSSVQLGELWTQTNRPGQGWVPINCPDGYVMTGITAPMEDWKIVNCRRLY
ncbi:shufflon system plasmid conjugative transfer pilus tip adhesin PilV [Pseudomonas chlororaphis]|uniref:Conjugative transfer pilus-tip adhesin protein PilV in PFGI-1-like cluster n=1 Tax=Pseudomonas chlororaphis subsp. aureofaciens TaxID=587851 RepID=A0AAD0ZGL7_9PSED|nr:Conjugative transfer pilus-tip adhesin protein PilV in PFGI-1-like cluster [Pseudomonas chlororaphis subsp. piscium]AZE31586.1 Conjugative transfer pilus-tip adhesin protein PilV in PFGI-1-like cluster [Pseudomonas chlororaphis subsp. aureofaciens]